MVPRKTKEKKARLMGVKRKATTKVLTPSQQKVIDVLQNEIIERYFSPAVSDDQFQILSTLRYDPYFTNVFTNLTEGRSDTHLSDIDSRLRLLDYEECDIFSVTQASGDDNGKLDNLFDAIGNSSSPVGDYERSLMTFINEGDSNEGSSAPQIDQENESLYPMYYKRFLLLGEHYKRLNFALDFFKWGTHIPLKLLLEKLIEALPEHHEVSNIEEKMSLLINESAPYKMRVLISKSGKMRVEAHPLSRPEAYCQFPSPSSYFINTILGGFIPNSSTIWNVFIDTEPMSVSPFTTFKTTFRDHYNASRGRLSQMVARYGHGSQNEILVYNDAYQLMEGSITNVAIKKYKENEPNKFRYVTPSLASGCLCGTMRYYLLKKKLLDEHPIDVRDLKEGDSVLIFNGVMGCVKGIIRQSLNGG